MLELPASPHITGLFAENVKTLRVVRITPEGAVVPITGPNGSGKSTVLDAIVWALGGTKHIDAMPIRRGEDTATIELTLGNVTITRAFYTADDGEQKSRITIRDERGAVYPSPQKLLDALYGDLTFDPLAFDRMAPKDRLEALRTAINLPRGAVAELEDAGDAAYQMRRETNRLLDQARAELTAMGAATPAGTEPEPEGGVLDAIATASQRAEERAAEAARRDRLAGEMERCYTTAEAQRAEADRLQQMATANTERAKTIAAELDALPALPDAPDTAALTARLESVRARNAEVERNRQRAALAARVDALATESQGYTHQLADLAERKAALIASVPMPVDGMALGDGDVLYNGIPFDQLNTAERIRICMAIGMKANPRLRVLLLREGSLLDSRTKRLVAEIAAAHDYQVWMECVDETQGVGIVLEEGAVVKVNAAAAP